MIPVSTGTTASAFILATNWECEFCAKPFSHSIYGVETMKKNFSHAFLLICLLFSVHEAMAARTATLVEQSVVFDEKSTRTPEQMRGYLLRAADVFDKVLTYKVEVDSPGALQLEFNKENENFFSVLFTYDQAGVKANYVSSKKMNYDESNGVRVIHPNYMVWMDALLKAARTSFDLQVNAKGEPTNPDAVAEITFRSNGDTDTVRFRTADDTNPCDKYDTVGWVANWSDDEIAAREKEKADWNAKYQTITVLGRRIEPQSLPPRSKTVTVASVHPVRFNLFSSHTEQGAAPSATDLATQVAFAKTGGSVSYSTTTICKLPTFRFAPQGARKYSVEFAMNRTGAGGGTCVTNVFDVTDPNQPIPMPVETVEECKSTVVDKVKNNVKGLFQSLRRP